MKAIELTGDIDADRHLTAQAPHELRPGRVRLLVLAPDDDPAESVWMHAVSAEWSKELGDLREDIYTLEDGRPLDDAR
jgi:hypothetical protein